MRTIGLLLLLQFCANAGAATAEQEVDYLITFVADSGCAFYRNDNFHESVDAADHLRNKYQRGKGWVNSAEQFIDRIASESSFSGKPYRVICEGLEMTSGHWLHQALEQHRRAMSTP